VIHFRGSASLLSVSVVALCVFAGLSQAAYEPVVILKHPFASGEFRGHNT
jgi:hypothetical protein